MLTMRYHWLVKYKTYKNAYEPQPGHCEINILRVVEHNRKLALVRRQQLNSEIAKKGWLLKLRIRQPKGTVDLVMPGRALQRGLG